MHWLLGMPLGTTIMQSPCPKAQTRVVELFQAHDPWDGTDPALYGCTMSTAQVAQSCFHTTLGPARGLHLSVGFAYTRPIISLILDNSPCTKKEYVVVSQLSLLFFKSKKISDLITILLSPSCILETSMIVLLFSESTTKI